MAVQTITYDDKVYINQNSTIPNINKVNDTDMNEIKSVVNNNATELTNITGTLLWANPNPTSSFSAQSITLSSSDYDVLEVFYYDWTSSKRMRSVKATKGEWISLDMMFRYNVKAYMGVRQIEPLSDTSLNIETCYSLVDNGSFAYNDYPNWCVPVYIIGYKTGLFN